MKIFLKRNVVLGLNEDGFENTKVDVSKDVAKGLIAMNKAEEYDPEKHDKLIKAAKEKAKTDKK